MRDVTIVVNAEVNGIPPGAKELRLWIPVPRDEGAQVLTRTIPEAPKRTAIVRDEPGNGALLIVLNTPAASASARATFDVSRVEQRGATAAHPLAHLQRDDPDAWLEPAIDAPAPMALFREDMPVEEKARAAFDHVRGANGDAALFVALLRAEKVAARIRAGFALPPDETEGTLTGTHRWAEWWNPESGWTPVDVASARFGSLDHDRVGFALGSDLVLPRAEVDGQPVAVTSTVTFRDRLLAFPGGPGVRPAATVEPNDQPYLQWELRSTPIPGHEHSPERHWFQEAVVLHAADGTIRWRAVLPDRMRGWQIGIGNAEAEGHRQYPRTTRNLYFLIGLEWTDVAVAIADATGVLVLSLDDGRVLRDLPFARGGDALWFDAGGFTLLDEDGETLGQGTSGGGRFFARVGDEWIYFNGFELAAIDIASLGVRDRTTWDRVQHRLPAKTAEVRARIPLGRRTVDIDGVIHLR